MNKKQSDSNKAIYAALLANLGVALMKYIVAFFSRSSSMFSEAIHSTSDTLNQILLLIGKRKAKEKSNEKHPFGYARNRYIYSALVAILLFFVGGIFAIYESTHKIEHVLSSTNHIIETNALLIAGVILIASICLEGFSLRTALKEVKHLNHKNEKTIHFFKRTKNSEIVVVAVEDSTALLGLFLALIGVSLTLLTHNPIYDAFGGLSIGLLLIIASIILGIRMKSLIIGESLSDEELTIIKTIIQNNPYVLHVIDIKSIHIGPEDVLLGIKIDYDDDKEFNHSGETNKIEKE
ncbi:MAG: cation diffusion facilitator family transporter, partial [Bacilli bacterium]|nr:cation diffusion facilitator family transporter [Bacilli bacterium]